MGPRAADGYLVATQIMVAMVWDQQVAMGIAWPWRAHCQPVVSTRRRKKKR
jgi:hypothetical protein